MEQAGLVSLTPDQLTELRERCEAAAASDPWLCPSCGIGCEDGAGLCETEHDDWAECYGCGWEGAPPKQVIPVPMAPALVLQLLAEIERLRGES